MKPRKALLAIGMVAVFLMALPAGQVMGAVEPPDPNANEKIVGPVMWGVVIMDNVSKTATLRVKKVDGCDIDTDPQMAILGSSVTSPEQVIYFRLASGSVFGLPCEPIITKVKNFKIDGDLVSFDCQIKFIVVGDATECAATP